MTHDKAHHFHFISGLPRSGSTLLAAILRQNPRFHAGMTSPVGSFYDAILSQVSAGSEFGPVVSKAQRHAVLRGLFDAYYQGRTGGEAVIFDTNRLWCARLPGLLELFPNAKVIACVRNVGWIMDSMERIYRANPFEHTRMFGGDGERGTVEGRVEALAQRDRQVGFAWSALKEAFYGEQSGSLLLVEYDLLARMPDRVLPLIYQFIGETPFEHDFEHLEYDAPDFDAGVGVSGLHRIRPKVSFQPRRTILPPDLFQRYAGLAFWHDLDGSNAHVISEHPAAVAQEA